MIKKYSILATIKDKSGNIVAVGRNSYVKTHPYQANIACRCGFPEKMNLHAEISAIIKAKGRGHSIHVERYGKDGKPRMAAPCKVCSVAIKEAGIKLVTYTTGA